MSERIIKTHRRVIVRMAFGLFLWAGTLLVGFTARSLFECGHGTIAAVMLYLAGAITSVIIDHFIDKSIL